MLKKSSFRMKSTISIFFIGIGVMKAQNTGIHTVSPTETLDVGDGNVRIREINSQIGDYEIDKVVVANSDGVLHTVSATMPKFFYMPSIVIPTAADQVPAGETFGTINLYQRYTDQFGGTGAPTLVSNPSNNTNLPILLSSELDYYITWYDENVFGNVVVDDNVVLTYDVVSGADVTVGSFMNVVFVVK